MPLPDNIDQFNRVVLHTLARLYAAFPKPTELNLAEIAALANPAQIASEHTLESLEASFEALSFLKDEGLIRYSDHYADGPILFQSQLSMKALTVLGQTRDNPDQLTMIARIRSALATGEHSLQSDAIEQVILQLFALAIAATPTANILNSKH